MWNRCRSAMTGATSIFGAATSMPPCYRWPLQPGWPTATCCGDGLSRRSMLREVAWAGSRSPAGSRSTPKMTPRSGHRMHRSQSSNSAILTVHSAGNGTRKSSKSSWQLIRRRSALFKRTSQSSAKGRPDSRPPRRRIAPGSRAPSGSSTTHCSLGIIRSTSRDLRLRLASSSSTRQH